MQELLPGYSDRGYLEMVLWIGEATFTPSLLNMSMYGHMKIHTLYKKIVFNTWLYWPIILARRTSYGFGRLDGGCKNIRRWFHLVWCSLSYVRNWLVDHYPEHWVGRNGPVAKPADSADLIHSTSFGKPWKLWFTKIWLEKEN